MNIPLSSLAPEKLVSRDGFGSPIPRQAAHPRTQAECGVYLRDSSRVPRRRPLIIYFNRHTFFFFFFLLFFFFSLPLRSDRGRFSRLLFFSSLSLLFVFFGCSDGMEREACVCDHGFERSDLRPVLAMFGKSKSENQKSKMNV